MTKFGTQNCVYGAVGNPTTYLGKTATWKGRQLTCFNGNAFTYDGQGRRISKNDITFTYDGNGNLLKQSNGIEFIYDNSGVIGVKYNNVQYFYRRDAQGNIIAILDSTGNVVVEYKYDAWGNHEVIDTNGNKITVATHIGNLNPFRYRGYYYDTETGLYYLQTRYYDPEVGRFISRDSIEYADPETINGLNLYAYCGNNPVNFFDLFGHIPIANVITKVAYTKLICGVDNFWWGRINYSTTVTIEQTEEAGIFYAQNIINNNENSWGAGINLWGWLGLEFGVDGNKNKLNVYSTFNITPWIHMGVSFGLNGISLSFGFNFSNISYDFSIGIGLAPVIVVGSIALLIISAGQALDVVVNWFKSIFGF